MNANTEPVLKPSTFRHFKTVGIVNDVPEGRGFWNPVDLAIAPDGRIYVQNRGPAGGSRVSVCNLAEDYLDEFASYGTGEGQMTLPTAIALDSGGRVYVADEHTHSVSVFTDSGEFVSRWGYHGSGPGMLNGPAGIAIDADDTVYLTDQYEHRVQQFTTDGEYIQGWDEMGSANGQLNMPWGISLDSGGNVWVADWRNDRIQKFASDSIFLATYGETGEGDGRFRRPSSVAVDTSGYIYVADWGNERVQVLDPDGRHEATLLGQAEESIWAREFFDANPEEQRTRELSDMNPIPDPHETPYSLASRSEGLF